MPTGHLVETTTAGRNPKNQNPKNQNQNPETLNSMQRNILASKPKTLKPFNPQNPKP
jgi:hypothetical protein